MVIVDYGVGNLFSLKSSFAFIGQEVTVSGDRDVIAKADRIILPGVGAFADAAEKLRKSGLDQVIIEETAKGKPLLGICLGMQMLFEKSYEFGETEGLGLIPGTVELMTPPDLLIPQIGWNKLEMNEKHKLMEGLDDDTYVYFVHSFAAVCDGSNVASYTDYGGRVPACVFNGNVCGCQFHPEKSGEAGLQIIRNFAAM